MRKKTETGQAIVIGSQVIENNGNQFELEIDFTEIESNQFGLELFVSEGEGLVLEMDRTTQTVSLNREKFEAAFGGEYGFVRTSQLKIDKTVEVQIFVDRSIVEIFINGGEVVFTARVFPKNKSNGINVFVDGKLKVDYQKHELAQGISY